MCKQKKRIDDIYLQMQERIRTRKDPYGMINHYDLRVDIARQHHSNKQTTLKIINKLVELNIIEPIGKNQLGIFYKVK